MNTYTPIVGMEIHVELKTKSKMFCGCKNDPFHAEKPNIYTCPVCLGMPGGLPVPNKKAIDWTIMLGQALGCDIVHFSKFDRKNYFYPDLAKGYQISQHDQPLCRDGKITTEHGTVRIHRVHLEEDTGKLQHTTLNGKKVSLVDFNRSGVPLMEIVTEPDIHSGDQAKAFLKKLHQIIRYLDISDADMEKGTMRLEPNISIQRFGETELPTYKVEVKNINSFNFVKKAIEYEVMRHQKLLEQGKVPIQETRGWNEDKNETFSQRRKEDADDYRYFPDPDIPPLRFTDDQLTEINHQLPELPEEKKNRFVKQYELNEQTAVAITERKQIADYFESVVAQSKGVSGKTVANWLIQKKPDIEFVSADELLKQIVQATEVIDISDDEIRISVNKIIAENAKAVADYKSGKEAVFMFLFGQTMKVLQGKGNKGKIQDFLKQSLGRS